MPARLLLAVCLCQRSRVDRCLDLLSGTLLEFRPKLLFTLRPAHQFFDSRGARQDEKPLIHAVEHPTQHCDHENAPVVLAESLVPTQLFLNVVRHEVSPCGRRLWSLAAMLLRLGYLATRSAIHHDCLGGWKKQKPIKEPIARTSAANPTGLFPIHDGRLDPEHLVNRSCVPVREDRYATPLKSDRINIQTGTVAYRNLVEIELKYGHKAIPGHRETAHRHRPSGVWRQAVHHGNTHSSVGHPCLA